MRGWLRGELHGIHRLQPGSGYTQTRTQIGTRRIQEPQASRGLSRYARGIGDARPVDVTQKLGLTGPGLPVGRGPTGV